MKVCELIEKLMEMDQDLDVVFRDTYGESECEHGENAVMQVDIVEVRDGQCFLDEEW